MAFPDDKAKVINTDYDTAGGAVENKYVAVLASAARTADVDTPDQTNLNYRGVIVVIDETAHSDSPSVVFTIQGKDETTGKYYTILASAAITGEGTTRLMVYPGATAAANAVVSEPLPKTWRVNCNAADTDSMTYAIGACYIL